MYIDDFTEEHFSEFARNNGYELVSCRKRAKKAPMFDICLRVKGTDIEFDCIVTDEEFRVTTHRARGLAESLTNKWHEFLQKRFNKISTFVC